MFTGIVAALGRIQSVTPLGSPTDLDAGVRLTISTDSLPLDDVQLGDSISIQGACMTVINKAAQSFDVDVSRESLNRTAGLDQPGEVNLEKALRAHDRLGGHIVSGHVDGLGTVTHFAAVGESHELRVLASREIGRYLAYKGSITVNGVSLTVNAVNDRDDGCEFSINLIPHTIKVTTLKHLSVGTPVNLEVDLIARYVERMLSTSSDTAKPLR
ncbi:riboflavin synthase [Paraburkholderia bonniea]|uniref:riboflavin synthase n=1 Tax=Paraburkholderia bonniea TaxID=2152891 RepID=UPI00129126C2|nr:riboflavin synthase [Paraburkholderia bonniea]WJF90918.1 riboflavin synthase [Paraburkholderia bonniea]WJF94232.1 riboflavin synthase [Paraburkholderia bonniea]